MAANTRLHAVPGWGSGELLTAAQITGIDLNAAGAVARGSSQSADRVLPLAPVDVFTAGGARKAYPVTGVVSCVNVADDLWFPLGPMPHGHVLDRIRIYVTPAGGHGGQPAVLPSAHLYGLSVLGVATLLKSATHTWSDVPTYEGGIVLDTGAGGFAETIDNDGVSYWLKVTLESGANSVSGLVIKSLRAHVTVDTTEGGPDFAFWP